MGLETSRLSLRLSGVGVSKLSNFHWLDELTVAVAVVGGESAILDRACLLDPVRNNNSADEFLDTDSSVLRFES